jgi:hypothetical protein
MKRVLLLIIAMIFVAGCNPQPKVEPEMLSCPDVQIAGDAFFYVNEVEEGNEVMKIDHDFVIIPEESGTTFHLREVSCDYGFKEGDNPEHVYCSMLITGFPSEIFENEDLAEAPQNKYYSYSIELDPSKTEPALEEHVDFEVLDVTCINQWLQ